MDFNKYLLINGCRELVSRHVRAPLSSRIAELIHAGKSWRTMVDMWEKWRDAPRGNIEAANTLKNNTRDEICPVCNGRGAQYINHITFAKECVICKGTGKLLT